MQLNREYVAERAVVEEPPGPLCGQQAVVVLQRHWHGLHGLAVAVLRDPHLAQDVVQDAFVGIIRSGSQFVDEDAALRYVRTAVINGCRSAMRRTATGRRHLRLIRSEHVPPADQKVLLDEAHTRVLALLDTLPVRQREVLTLRYLAQLDDGEIAAVLEIGTSTVRSTASRALATLTRQLKGTRDHVV